MKLVILLLTLVFSASQAVAKKATATKSKDLRNQTTATQDLKSAKFRGGNIYEMNSEKKNLIFIMKAELKKPMNGKTVFSSFYFDTDKNEIMTEEASFDHLNLKKYVIHQKQINEIYELEVSGNKMNFSVTKDGQTEKITRDLPENLVIGPSFVPFLQKHWSEIQNQKKVEAALAVLDRMDTYRFEFEKIRDLKFEGQDRVIVRMKPGNTLISSVVRPVYFVVAPDGSRILELKGRMLPKRKVGSRWEDFEGEAVFMY